ncbi:MAG: hypothetical protein QOH21_1088 [Acidobacteriota bacterium]|jgi:hypothetical protein|nr:hypothetical protein [Acidobacteriota bacterium]
MKKEDRLRSVTAQARYARFPAAERQKNVAQGAFQPWDPDVSLANQPRSGVRTSRATAPRAFAAPRLDMHWGARIPGLKGALGYILTPLRG